EYDHADIFPDLAAIETQFHHLVRTIPGEGRVIVPAGQPALDRVLERGIWSEVATVGEGAPWTTSPPAADGSFTVHHQGETLGTVTWSHTGAHNRANALAAIVAAEHVGVSPATAIDALSGFVGVRRRMESRGQVNDIALYDDFAHHTPALATTMPRLREQHSSNRVHAVHEMRYY